jgi:pre-mRNA-splicing factor ATP-dependent RNA helicase DHX15/PRP43
VPDVWIRPNNQQKDADASKQLLTVPYSDHLTLLNVYNQYIQSELPNSCVTSHSDISTLDLHDRNWTWSHYLLQHVLAQADNVRSQLQRTMELFDMDLVSQSDEQKLYINIQQALVCGFFMQVAHKEGEKGNYVTVKENQASINCTLPPRIIALTCGLRLLCSTHPVAWTHSLSG